MAPKRPVREIESVEMSAESSHGEEDDAPDEVAFSSAREKAERNVKAALESVRRDKVLLKEKRRRKMELFRQQKKHKMLPDAILQQIASIPGKKGQISDTSKRGHVGAPVQKPDQDSGLEEDAEECIDVRWRARCKAVQLKDHGRKVSQVNKAKAFIKNQLYGPNSGRTSVNEYFSFENKRMQKAAMQFVDPKWQSSEKQKADKFRKLWMQKHGPLRR
ncbi:U3 small nucleolar RNA-associated protein NOL7 [Mobula birostris]|uniref:U3 small nucleolar RNA-associated protein NOL7 n=1 Tax=Mobula birostris TaxID=1983395 RepID=UPI003B286F3E